MIEDGEQVEYIWSSIDVPKDPSDTNVSEQEVIQPNVLGEKEMTHQQLIQSERIHKPNLNYVNTTIVEGKVKEPEMYE